MKEVLVRTKLNDSFTLVVSDNSANIQTTFNPPLYLQTNRNYELAMVNLETYYRIFRCISRCRHTNQHHPFHQPPHPSPCFLWF